MARNSFRSVSEPLGMDVSGLRGSAGLSRWLARSFLDRFLGDIRLVSDEGDVLPPFETEGLCRALC